MSHTESEPAYGQSRVAFDVASGPGRFAGNANIDDVRDRTEIKVPELPWPMRFYWVRWEDETGERGVSCVGFEIGAPLSRASPDDTEVDIDAVTLTAERWTILQQNFHRYLSIAEQLRYPTPGNREKAAKKRTAMRRRARAPLSDDFLAGVVAEWRTYSGQPGDQTEFGSTRGVTRFTVRRWLMEAEKRGLYPEGASKRRTRSWPTERQGEDGE